MDITLKDTKANYHIGNKDFTIDLGDPAVLDAHDQMLDFLGKVAEDNGATSTEVNDRLNEYLKTVFGDDQYADLEKIGATNHVNAQRITVAIVADVNKLNSENNVTKIMEEFGL